MSASEPKSRVQWFVRHHADLCLLVTALLWGINIPVVKFATSNMDGLAFNALRMVLSTLTLGLILWLELFVNRVNETARTPDQRQSTHRFAVIVLMQVVAFSLLSGLVYPLAFMHGIHRTTAGNTALLLASMPMWTALLSMIFLSERLVRLTWIGLVVTFIGTALIIQAKGSIDLSEVYLLGNLLILLGAMVWATATVVSTPILKFLSPLKLAFVSAFFTTPIHLVMNVETIAEQWYILRRIDVLGSLLFSGILSTGVAYATWHYGVRKLGGSHAAAYQNVVTMVAVIVSWLVLAEPVLPLQIVGGAIAIVGLFILRQGRR
ncbi:MAG: DMT family transporter [Pirellula sp.]|nr:DMT family transporter [Pirellula sp.]